MIFTSALLFNIFYYFTNQNAFMAFRAARKRAAQRLIATWIINQPDSTYQIKGMVFGIPPPRQWVEWMKTINLLHFDRQDLIMHLQLPLFGALWHHLVWRMSNKMPTANKTWSPRKRVWEWERWIGVQGRHGEANWQADGEWANRKLSHFVCTV